MLLQLHEVKFIERLNSESYHRWRDQEGKEKKHQHTVRSQTWTCGCWEGRSSGSTSQLEDISEDTGFVALLRNSKLVRER